MAYVYIKMTTTCPKFAAVWGPKSVASHNMGSLRGIALNDVHQTRKDGDCDFIGWFPALNEEVAVVSACQNLGSGR